MKNFKIQEFVCHCGCQMPAEARQNIEALVTNVLDPLRDEYGKPIYVNSGYRCEKHNEAVGGVPRSQHLVGQAADIGPGFLFSHGSFLHKINSTCLCMRKRSARIGQPLPYGRITYTGSKGRAFPLSAAKRHPQRRRYYSTKGSIVNS